MNKRDVIPKPETTTETVKATSRTCFIFLANFSLTSSLLSRVDVEHQNPTRQVRITPLKLHMVRNRCVSICSFPTDTLLGGASNPYQNLLLSGRLRTKCLRDDKSTNRYEFVVPCSAKAATQDVRFVSAGMHFISKSRRGITLSSAMTIAPQLAKIKTIPIIHVLHHVRNTYD